MYIIRNTSSTAEKTFGLNRFMVERNTDYTLYFKGFNNSSLVSMDVWFLKRVKGSTANFDSAQQLISNRKLSIASAEDIVVTFNTGNFDEGYIRF
ncbi:PblB-type protein, partial [human gut metagenome]